MLIILLYKILANVFFYFGNFIRSSMMTWTNASVHKLFIRTISEFICHATVQAQLNLIILNKHKCQTLDT